MALKGMARPKRGRVATRVMIGSAPSDPVETGRFPFWGGYRPYFYGVYPSAEEV